MFLPLKILDGIFQRIDDAPSCPLAATPAPNLSGLVGRVGAAVAGMGAAPVAGAEGCLNLRP